MSKKDVPVFKNKRNICLIFLAVGCVLAIYMSIFNIKIKDETLPKMSFSDELPFYGRRSSKSYLGQKVNLKNWDIDVKIESDGSLSITEVWNSEYGKDISTMYRNFGKGVGDKYISDAKVFKMVDGKEIPLKKREYAFKQWNGYYHTGYTDGIYEIGWGVDKSKKNDVYVLKYNIYGMTSFIKDYAEIYYKMISDNSLYTTNFTATISHHNLPLTKDNSILFGHGDSNIKYIYDKGKIYIKSYAPVAMKDLVEFRLFIPKSFLIQNEKINQGKINKSLDSIIDEERKIIDVPFIGLKNVYKLEGKIYGFLIIYFTVGIIYTVFNIDYMIAYQIRKNKNKKRIKETIKEFKYYSQIPEDFDLDLFCASKVSGIYIKDVDIIKSSILKLIYYKYISIKVNESENKTFKIFSEKTKCIYVLEKTKNEMEEELEENPDKLSSIDKFIFGLLDENKDENNEVTEDKFIKCFDQKAEKYGKAKDDEEQKAKTKLTDAGYFIKKEYTAKSDYEIYMNKLTIKILLGFIILTALLLYLSSYVVSTVGSIQITGQENVRNIICLTYFTFLIRLFIVRREVGLKSMKGIQRGGEIYALKKYFEDFSRIEERDEKALVIWEKLLIYATFFGLGNNVLKNLQKLNPEVYNEINSVGSGSFLNNVSNRALTSAISSYYLNSGGSNGFSSGGSFSGGGFGGGSGGGR